MSRAPAFLDAVRRELPATLAVALPAAAAVIVTPANQVAKVVAGATTVYAALTFRIVISGQKDRDAAAKRERREVAAAGLSAYQDLRHNAARSHYQRGNAKLLFASGAVTYLRQYHLADLPPDVADAVEVAGIRMAEFDDLARFFNVNPDVAAYGHLNEPLQAAHQEAHEACAVARDGLARFLRTFDPSVAKHIAGTDGL